MKQAELVKLLKHFRDQFERIERCYLNPNVDEDEYALDDGKCLTEILEEAIKELTELLQGSVVEIDKHCYDIWDEPEDKRSNFEKAFDSMTAKIIERETDKGAWNEAKRQEKPSVADIMGETFQYKFQPAVLPKEEKKDEK